MRQLENGANPTEIVILSVTLSSTFTYMLMICEPGEHVTKHFDSFGEEFEQCYWHLLPIFARRLYLIFLLDSQKMVYIECYGRISCTRDTLKKVLQRFKRKT